MEEKDKRPIYEPPKAKDISAISVSGQRPCQTGPYPHGLCSEGGSLAPAPCSPTGQTPIAPNCGGGSNPS